MCHHTMCATTVERMGMEMADTGNNDDEQQWIATMLERLSHSQFRAKFALTDKDRAYARTKGKATATCCRGCIEKWHHLPKGRELAEAEVNRLADLVMAWIERDLINHPVR